MELVDIVVIAVVAAIVGMVIWYLYRAKKKGVKCIGCPDGAKCSQNCSCCSGNCGSCGDDQ